MKITPRPAMLVMLIIMGILMLLSGLTSCTGCSESGRRSVATQSNVKKVEKVVIIDGLEPVYAGAVTSISYKVKRLDYGVVVWIKLVNTPRYESGDTILYSF